MSEDKPLPRWTTWVIVGGVTVYSLMAIGWRWWPFHAKVKDLGADPSLWQLLLGNRLTLGSLRLFFFIGGLYLSAWLVILAINNIWPAEWTKGGIKWRRLKRDTTSAKSDIEAAQDRVNKLLEEMAALRRGGKPPGGG
jgi:hypothetical protein